MKYVNKLEDFELQVKNKKEKYEDMDNATEFTDPEIEPEVDELSGYAGMPGTIEMPDWTKVGAPELVLKFAKIPDNGDLLLNPGGTSVKATWAESLISESGEKTYDSYSIYAEGFPKNIPGGDKKKGERPEIEVKIACRKYIKKKGSKTIVNYDPMNGKVEIYGVNYAAGAKNAMAQN